MQYPYIYSHRHYSRLHCISRLLFISMLFLPKVIADQWEGQCVAVTDGDTISVMRDGEAEKIRLYGVDCPEMGQNFGNEAKEFTSAMTLGKKIKVIGVQKNKDKYGRTVADVEIDGEKLNRELIVNGWAWVDARYCQARECAEWQRLQKQAQENGVGIWGGGKDKTDSPPVSQENNAGTP
ncbi:MAG: thermonuclease family protein [Planctomycetota bacterium]|nr:thermonuclease family protein [Planctomycetota bacterium]